MDAAGFLAHLRRRTPIGDPVAIVVAHPDDETIGAGASLSLLRHLTLIHVTDGAPASMQDARTAGFVTAQGYAAARRDELRRAMQAAGAAPDCVALGVGDQRAVRHLAEIVSSLRGILARCALVITHAYEGGHPDHDACALAVQRACAMLPRPPAVLEFPAYHAAADGDWVVQRFLPSGPQGEALRLDPSDVARKRTALACFATQRDTLARFDPGREVFRAAPAYEFCTAPHEGTLLYERFGWGITGAQWRCLAGAGRQHLPRPLREGVGGDHARATHTSAPSPRRTPATGGGIAGAPPGRPLHILSVAYPFAPVGPDAVGGAEQVLSAIDRALVGAGHRSTVVACAGSDTAGTLLAHDLPSGAIDDAVRARVHRQVRDTIAGALRDGSVDLIHLHGIDFADYLPPPGPPCLVTLHLPPGWYPAHALRPERPDTWLHGVSAKQHRACPGGDRLLPPIPNGVPVEALSAHRHARRGFALTLGRICLEKAQHLALDAAHAAGLPLLLGGAVFPYAAHQSYFADCIAPRLDRQRRWLGALPFPRKRRLLSAARCLLVPSTVAETASLVAMEAMACGTPVIAFPLGALTDVVEPGRTGFLVRDVAGMAAAMHRAAEIDPALCRRTARRRFSLRHMTDAYLARYAERVARMPVAA